MNAQCTLFIQVVSTPKLNQLTAGMAAGHYTQKWIRGQKCRISQIGIKVRDKENIFADAEWLDLANCQTREAFKSFIHFAEE